MNQLPTAGDRRDPDVLEDATREAKAVAGLEADEVSALARHRDPSRRKTGASVTSAVQRHPGVAWVRPSELLAGSGGRLLGRGIDLHAELTRRTLALPIQAAAASRRAIRDRALRLPPLSSFGRRGSSDSAPTWARTGLR